MEKSFNTQVTMVNNAAAQKSDMEHALKPYMNWHSLLSAAPASIAILGNITLIAGKKDFTLKESMPQGGFKFIRYPDSLRASLMQLVNESHAAMQESHTKMDQIRLYSQGVPNFLKGAVQLLMQGTQEQVGVMLPTHLKKIQDVADNCNKLALQVEKKYNDVTCLIDELLEASTASDGSIKKKQEKAEIDRRSHEIEKDRLELENERDNKALEEMKAEIREKQSDLKKAMDDQKSGWGLLAMGIAEKFAGGLTSAAGLVRFGKNSENDATKENETQIDKKGITKMDQLIDLSEQLTKYVSNDGLNLKEIADTETGALMLKNQIERMIDDLDDSKPVQAEVKRYSNQAVTFCENVLTQAKNFDEDPEKVNKIFKKIQDFLQTVKQRKVKFATKEVGNPLPAPGPRKQMADKKAGMSLLNTVIETERHKVDVFNGQLDKAKARYDKAIAEQRENDKRMTEILKGLESIKIDKLDLKEIKTILKQAITTLASLKEEWSKLARIFSGIANIIKVTLSENLVTFKSTASDHMQLVLDGCTYDDLMRDQIYSQAMQSNVFAYFVNHIATSYCEISDNHIMPQVSRLPILAALDPEMDLPQILELKEKLTKDCKLARESISKLVTDDHEKFMEDIEKRRSTVEKELGSLVGPSDPNIVAAIKEAVEEVAQEEKYQIFSEPIDAGNFC